MYLYVYIRHTRYITLSVVGKSYCSTYLVHICVVVKNVLKIKKQHTNKNYSFDDYLTKIYLTKLEQIGKR
jgi:hypothetical protein